MIFPGEPILDWKERKMRRTVLSGSRQEDGNFNNPGFSLAGWGRKQMYGKILVPLDGSKLAECVLPHLEALVQGCQVKEAVFVRAVEPFLLPRRDEYVLPPDDIEKINAQTATEARDYLKGLAEGFHFSGVKTTWEVLTGLPPSQSENMRPGTPLI